jgi:hypothetical protein
MNSFPGPAASPDWPHLWQLVTRWAGRPFGGVILPAAEQGQVAVTVFEDLPRVWPRLPGHAELLGWLQREAQQRAIARTAAQRVASGKADLWHDPAWQPGEPVLDMAALRRRDARGGYSSPEWQRLHDVLKRRALRILPGVRHGIMALPESAADDVFMEALTELIRERPEKGTLLDELPLWEHVPAVFNTIIKRRGIDWLRREGQRKNEPNASARQTSFDDPDSHLAESLRDPASPGNTFDSFHGVTFDRIYRACGQCLTAIQWHIITAIYIEETATRLDLASDEDLLRQLDVSPASSESTRRRAINAQLEAAITHLAECLQIRDV